MAVTKKENKENIMEYQINDLKDDILEIKESVKIMNKNYQHDHEAIVILNQNDKNMKMRVDALQRWLIAGCGMFLLMSAEIAISYAFLH